MLIPVGLTFYMRKSEGYDQTVHSGMNYFFVLLCRKPGPRSAVGIASVSRARGFRVRYPVRPLTSVSFSADSRRAVVRYWRKYVHEVLVNRLGGLSLPRKSVVRLTDRPDMTLAVTADVYNNTTTTTTTA